MKETGKGLNQRETGNCMNWEGNGRKLMEEPGIQEINWEGIEKKI